MWLKDPFVKVTFVSVPRTSIATWFSSMFEPLESFTVQLILTVLPGLTVDGLRVNVKV